MPNLIQRMMPFFILGILIVILLFGIVLLSYLLIFGAIVGFALYIAAWLKEKLFPSKQMTQVKRPGRTFDNNDPKP